MPIFKAKISSEYVIVPNETIQDKRLTFEARGLLAFLLSLPEDWAIHKKWLLDQSPAGREKLTRIMRELEFNGYLSKTASHNNDGKITGIDWFVYPYDTVIRVYRNTGLPDDGKPATTKETSLKNKQNTNTFDFADLVHNAFYKSFWPTWLEIKKKCNSGAGPKTETYEKKWKPLFNKSYFKNKNEKDFRDEVTRICDFAETAHSHEGFNRFTNMHPGKFFTEKQWRD